MSEYLEKFILNRIQVLANKQFNGFNSLNTTNNIETVNRVCLLLMDWVKRLENFSNNSNLT
jgi:hypothetical protein